MFKFVCHLTSMQVQDEIILRGAVHRDEGISKNDTEQEVADLLVCFGAQARQSEIGTYRRSGGRLHL